MKNISKYFFPFLLLFVAIGLATVAAYFSVTGLGKLFAGAKEAVIVMASILELAKIVCASWLHRNWKDKNISKILKTQLTIGVGVLMCITSAGIYGFLSNAYFDTSSKLGRIDTEISLLEKQRVIYDTKIISLNQAKKSKTDRIQSLTLLRSQQETRIDSLYKKGMVSAVKRTENQIKDANKEINTLLVEVDGIDAKIQMQNDSITKIELGKADLGDNDIAAEVGPLKYIAKITDTPMDEVINWFILALIFVFDPLAIAILIASNYSMEKTDRLVEEERNKKQIVEEKKEDEIQVVEEKVDVEEMKVEEENDGVIDGISEDVLIKESESEEKENIPTKVVEFFENKEETEKEFKKKIEELNKQNNPQEELVDSKEESIEEIESNEIKEIQEQEVKLEEIVEEEKTEEPIEVSPVIEEIHEIEKKEERDTLYLNLLTILFKNGEIKQGDEIPSYKEFLNEVKKTELKYTEKLLRDFLTTCNLVKAIDTSDSKRIALKTFEKAKEIIKEI